MRGFWAALVLLCLVAPPLGAQTVSARNQFKFARSFAEDGNWERALEEVDKALAEEPNYLDATYLKALCLLGLDRYEDSEKEFLKVLDHDPQFFNAYLNLGQLYLETEAFDKAEATFGKMMMLKNGKPTALYALGVVAYARGEPAEAERHWRNAQAMQPPEARLHSNIGAALKAQGKDQPALSEFREAARLEPESPRYLFNLAWQLNDLGHKDLALAELKKAERFIGEDASLGFAVKSLGALLEGKAEDALKLARSAQEQRPDLAQAVLLEARALEALQKPAEAREVYRRALEEDPNLLEAAAALERLPAPEEPPASEEPAPPPSEEAGPPTP